MDLLFQKFVEIIREKFSDKGGYKVLDKGFLSPEELKKKIDVSVGEKAMSETEIAELIEDVLQYSLRTGHPYFMNQMFGAVQPIALLADLLLPVFNTSMYTYEVAPVFTLMEKEITGSLSRLVWQEEGDGVFTGGGSLSNMYAMYLALQQHSDNWKKTGLHQAPRFAVFISEEAHYSFMKGTAFLGLGQEALIILPSGKNARTNPEIAEKMIEQSIQNGRTPLMITGIAGTTKTGHIDPLSGLGALAKRYGMWFHVDAAFGGAQLFHEEYRQKLSGIEMADSVTWNFHKVMGMPLSTSSFLTREKGVLAHAFDTRAEYLFHDDDTDYNLGQKSLRGGRRPDVFKLWLSWKHLGSKGLAQYVESLQKKTEFFAALVEKNTELELFALPDTSIICFRYKDENLSPEETDEFNIKIRNTLIQNGQMLFNYTPVQGKIYLRYVLLNPDISGEELEHLVNSVISTARELLKTTG